MATIERVLNVPLRKKYSKTQAYRRAKKAVLILRAFVEKNMKSKDVVIDTSVNEALWSNGIKNPPSKIKVKAVKDDSGKVKVTLEV